MQLFSFFMRGLIVKAQGYKYGAREKKKQVKKAENVPREHIIDVTWMMETRKKHAQLKKL